jgi:hypothetical protein
MDEKSKEELRAILEKGKRNKEEIRTIGDVEDDRIVRVVVKNPRDGSPMIAQAEILARNETFGEVLTLCGRGTTEFPLDYPCLFDPTSRTASEIEEERWRHEEEMERWAEEAEAAGY